MGWGLVFGGWSLDAGPWSLGVGLWGGISFSPYLRHMKSSIVLVVIVFLSVVCGVKVNAQNSPSLGPQKTVKYDTSAVWCSVEHKATFKGGETALREYIVENFVYPKRCAKAKIDGYVLMKFMVDSTGAVTRVSALEETVKCPEFTAEAIRVFQSSPKWIPGLMNGRYVNSWREMPLRLSIR